MPRFNRISPTAQKLTLASAGFWDTKKIINIANV